MRPDTADVCLLRSGRRLTCAALLRWPGSPGSAAAELMSSPLAAAVFVAAAALSPGASTVLVVRLERLGGRLGLSEALLGLVAAPAADTPEVTSALARG